MNQNLIEAMTSIERAKALLFAYEKVFLDLNVEPECQELAGMAIKHLLCHLGGCRTGGRLLGAAGR